MYAGLSGWLSFLGCCWHTVLFCKLTLAINSAWVLFWGFFCQHDLLECRPCQSLRKFPCGWGISAGRRRRRERSHLSLVWMSWVQHTEQSAVSGSFYNFCFFCKDEPFVKESKSVSCKCIETLNSWSARNILLDTLKTFSSEALYFNWWPLYYIHVCHISNTSALISRPLKGACDECAYSVVQVDDLCGVDSLNLLSVV